MKKWLHNMVNKYLVNVWLIHMVIKKMAIIYIYIYLVGGLEQAVMLEFPPSGAAGNN